MTGRLPTASAKLSFFASFKKKLHFKYAFANILLISFIFNFKFMFFTHTIVVDLIFVDFRFYSFRIEIFKIHITVEFVYNEVHGTLDLSLL